MTFLGTLRATHARRLVELQVRRGSRWMTFATTHASRGRFRAGYRFTRTWSTTRYALRARVQKEDGFPFERV